MKVKSESEVSQSCPTLSDPMDCSPPGSSVHGIFQARVLEWGAIAFSVLSYTYSLYYVEVCSFYTHFVEVLMLTFVESFFRHENPKSTSCVANLQSRWSRLEPLEDGRLQEEGFRGENGNLMKQAVSWRFLEKLKKGLLETLS